MKPFFSIIIPTYNRPRQLARCLAALAAQDYPRHGFEVIVVDDGSAVSPDGVVARVAEGMQVQFLRQANAGPAKARNLAAAAARGDYLAFTDDDCLPAVDWLKTLTARFAVNPEQALGGPLISSMPHNSFSAVSHLILETVYAYYNASTSGPHILATANLALTASRFRALGGFDESFRHAEDREFCDRWRKEGYEMAYAPEARVYHSGPVTFRHFCRQYFGYGRGAYCFFQARLRRGSDHGIPEGQFYRSFLPLLGRIYARDRNCSVRTLAFLLSVWQMANAAGFFWEGFTARSNIPRS